MARQFGRQPEGEKRVPRRHGGKRGVSILVTDEQYALLADLAVSSDLSVTGLVHGFVMDALDEECPANDEPR